MKILYFLSLVLISGQMALARPIIDWREVPAECRAKVMQAIILEEVVFQDQTLEECLKELSRLCRITIGNGFGFSIRGLPSTPISPITMRLQSVRLAEVLAALARGTGAKIEMTADGCVVEFPSEDDLKKED